MYIHVPNWGERKVWMCSRLVILFTPVDVSKWLKSVKKIFATLVFETNVLQSTYIIRVRMSNCSANGYH